MKLVKKASGKTTVKMSQSEWTNLGKKAGWFDDSPGSDEDFNKDFGVGTATDFSNAKHSTIREDDKEEIYQHSEESANMIFDKARPILEFMESYDGSDVNDFGEIMKKSNSERYDAKEHYRALKKYFLGR